MSGGEGVGERNGRAEPPAPGASAAPAATKAGAPAIDAPAPAPVAATLTAATSTTRTPARRAALPLAFIALSLFALVLLPIVVQRRTAAHRQHITAVAEPARAILQEVQLSLAIQVAAVRGYLLSNDSSFLDRLREARATEAQAIARLRPLAERIGPEATTRLAALQGLEGRWHAAQDQMRDGRMTKEAYIGGIARYQDLYEETMAASARLAAALSRFASDERRAIEQSERFATGLSAFLALLALTSALLVARLARAQRTLAAALRERAQGEQALREVSHSLSAVLKVEEVMRRVSEAAVTLTAADGAYVEQIISRDGEVEVVAATGTGVPPLGTRVGYPGSLTEEIIEGQEPAFITELKGIGKAIAPYLATSCDGCSVLVVPLVSQGEALGALMTLRHRGRPAFEPHDIERTRTLGELASVALRRVLLLNEAERRRAEAEAAVRSRDEVLSIVSHDLRNPLSTIIMSAALLEDADIPLTEAKRAQQMAIVKRSAGRMNRLIQDLLDATRMERGRLSIHCQRVALGPLVSEACEGARPLAGEKSIELACSIAPDLPPVDADRDRIQQVLGNLIGNAVKFTPVSGRITVAADVLDGAVHVAVTDTGPGLSTEDRERVFDRFWQAKRTAHLGTGLGLSIAQGIVLAHNGRIWVESDPGLGATFHFTLPPAGTAAAPAASSAARPAAASPAAPAGRA